MKLRSSNFWAKVLYIKRVLTQQRITHLNQEPKTKYNKKSKNKKKMAKLERATYSVLKIYYLSWKICYRQQFFWENSIPNLLIL